MGVAVMTRTSGSDCASSGRLRAAGLASSDPTHGDDGAVAMNGAPGFFVVEDGAPGFFVVVVEDGAPKF